MQTYDLKEGDIVELKSGSFPMVIDKVNHYDGKDTIFVRFCQEGKIQLIGFSPETLIKRELERPWWAR